MPPVTDWVHSGHGLYPVWSFAEPVADSPAVRELLVDVFEVARAAFAERGYSIDDVKDAARVWRIPGTVNRKAEPVMCTIEHRSGEVYTFAELRERVPITTGGTDSSSGAYDGPRLFTVAEASQFIRGQALAPLAATRDTGRNIALNKAATVLGHFVPEFFDEAKAKELLREALAKTGYLDTDAQAAELTMSSGLAFGQDVDRQNRRDPGSGWIAGRRPEPETGETADVRRLVVVRGSQVTPKTAHWLWQTEEYGASRSER